MVSNNTRDGVTDGIPDSMELSFLCIKEFHGFICPMVIKAALKLNIFDIIAAKSKSNGGRGVSVDDIASEIGKTLDSGKTPDTTYLYRILRYLVGSDFLRSEIATKEPNNTGKGDRLYIVAPKGKILLRNTDTASITTYMDLVFHPEMHMVKALLNLHEGVDGSNIFATVHGKSVFECARESPSLNATFNRAMADPTTIYVRNFIARYGGFAGVKTVVDVGGGTGTSLKMILDMHPHIHGINFDLPHVLESAPKIPGIEHVGGSFFEGVPHGDLMVLKWILHDWDDEACVKILKSCKKSLPKDGKIVMIEILIPEVIGHSLLHHLALNTDIFVLASMPGGMERSLSEYQALATAAGFGECKIVLTEGRYSLLEVQ